jgi:hypothetical protein
VRVVDRLRGAAVGVEEEAAAAAGELGDEPLARVRGERCGT